MRAGRSRIGRRKAKGCAEGREPTVRILENLFGPTVENYGKAMSRATLRSSLLTNNLANVNTPGYKRRDVSFDMALEGEKNKFASLNRDSEIQTDTSSIRVDGNNVDMETEVMGLAETEQRYNALTEMSANYFNDLKTVIKGQ